MRTSTVEIVPKDKPHFGLANPHKTSTSLRPGTAIFVPYGYVLGIFDSLGNPILR